MNKIRILSDAVAKLEIRELRSYAMVADCSGKSVSRISNLHVSGAPRLLSESTCAQPRGGIPITGKIHS